MEPVKQAVFERTFDAPVERVWQAWTDPAQVKEWWGPDNVTIPECEIDLRPGGKLYIVMEAAAAMGEYAGTRWPMEGAYTAVEPNKRLSYATKAWTVGAEESTQIDQTADLVLSEEDGKTNMVLTVEITHAGPGAKMALEGMQWGYNQQFDKLEKYLANM